MMKLFHYLHVFAAADESTTTGLGNCYFVTTDIAPVFIADRFNAHV